MLILNNSRRLTAQHEYSLSPWLTAGSELTLADDVECFWLPGRPTASAASTTSGLSRQDSQASELLPVSSQRSGLLGEICTQKQDCHIARHRESIAHVHSKDRPIKQSSGG